MLLVQFPIGTFLQEGCVMKTEATVLFHSYKGVSLVAVCQREKRKNMREVWIYPNGSPMDQSFANELLNYLRTIDDDEVLECDARLNWLVTEYLDGRDARQVRFSFSVLNTPVGFVVCVLFGNPSDAPELEGISLESSE